MARTVHEKRVTATNFDAVDKENVFSSNFGSGEEVKEPVDGGACS